MQEQETVNVYKFEDLAPEVQAGIIESERHEYAAHGYETDDLATLLEEELENRNHPGLEQYFSLFSQGSGVGLDGALYLSDLLAAETEEWQDTDGKNVHLKPSQVRAVMPTMLKTILGMNPAINLYNPGRHGSNFTRVNADDFLNDIEDLVNEWSDHGREDDAENVAALRDEANAFVAIVETYTDSLTQCLYRMLEDESLYLSSEEVVRERLTESLHFAEQRYTIDGIAV